MTKTNEIIVTIKGDLATSCDQADQPGQWFSLSEEAHRAMLRIRLDGDQGERAQQAARAAALVRDLAHQQWKDSIYKNDAGSLKECIGQAIRLI